MTRIVCMFQKNRFRAAMSSANQCNSYIHTYYIVYSNYEDEQIHNMLCHLTYVHWLQLLHHMHKFRAKCRFAQHMYATRNPGMSHSPNFHRHVFLSRFRQTKFFGHRNCTFYSMHEDVQLRYTDYPVKNVNTPLTMVLGMILLEGCREEAL